MNDPPEQSGAVPHETPGAILPRMFVTHAERAFQRLLSPLLPPSARTRIEIVLWQLGGRPVPPPAHVKRRLIRSYLERFNIDVFLETGTHRGDTLAAVANNVGRAISVELDAGLYAEAKSRFALNKKVELLHGDSASILPQVVNAIDQPCLFWLDAHYSGPGTAVADRDTPVCAELNTILRRQQARDVILIDDARLFDGSGDYPTLAVLEQSVRRLAPASSVLVRDDIIRILPNTENSGVTSSSGGPNQSAPPRCHQSSVRARVTAGISLVASDVAVVGSPRTRNLVSEALKLDGHLREVAPSRLAAFTRPFRTAAVAIVSDMSVLPSAALSGRMFRIPWTAFFDQAAADRLSERGIRRVHAACLRQAAAILVPADRADVIRDLLPGTRIVDADSPEQSCRVLEDVALPSCGRARGGYGLGASLVGTWLFVDDRATRLAIRLVPVTGKAPTATHPKHLIGVPWHLWYLNELRAQDRVLDVGCSNGAHTLRIAPLVRQAIGVDVDEAALAEAADRAEHSGICNVAFRVADLSDPASLHGWNERFDAVLALDVLEHLVDRHLVLTGIRELLAPTGRLIVAVPNVGTSYKRWRAYLGGAVYSDPDHKVEYSESAIRGELESAGFRITRFERGGYDTPFGGLTALLGALSLRLYRRIAARRHRLAQRRPAESTAFRVVAVPDLDATTRA